MADSSGTTAASKAALLMPAHSKITVSALAVSPTHLPWRSSVPRRYQVQREITLHLQLEHENIIQLYAAWEDDQAVYLVQELAAGDLFKEVKKRDGEPADESLVVRDYMYPFLSALKYLHGKVRMHGCRRRGTRARTRHMPPCCCVCARGYLNRGWGPVCWITWLHCTPFCAFNAYNCRASATET